MQLLIDADSLFYDAYSIPEKPRYGFAPVHYVGQSVIPEEITDEVIAKGLERVRRRIDEMHDRLFGPEVKVAVGGADNFRYAIHPDYKRKRSENKTILADLAKITIGEAIAQGWATPSDGFEADDLVRIWAHSAKDAGVDYVVAHLDKDLNCIVGRHFNYRQNVMYDVNIESAMNHYFTQLIMGDSTDNIPGARGVGKVKAAKFLDRCETLEEYQEATVEAYMSAHPGDWYEQLQFNGKLIHILRHPTDYFSCDAWPVVQALR